jgi:hypothetical protein
LRGRGFAKSVHTEGRDVLCEFPQASFNLSPSTFSTFFDPLQLYSMVDLSLAIPVPQDSSRADRGGA